MKAARKTQTKPKPATPPTEKGNDKELLKVMVPQGIATTGKNDDPILKKLQCAD